jgi:hypothetical protein
MKYAMALMAMLGASMAMAEDSPPPIGTIPLDDVIAQLDRNGNGCVDLEEGRNYTSRRFHALDANADGTLDAVEAPPGPSETTNDRPISVAAWQDAYTARFERFDGNSDGCLTTDEVAAGRAASTSTGG